MRRSTWLEMAASAAKDSKCVSLKVGTVLVKDDHMISTGVNGSPKGFTNCCELFDERGPEHSKWSEKFEIHSEMSALLYCQVCTKGSIAFVTHAPCFNCCKHLIAAGIKSIHFTERYYRMPDDEFAEIIDFCSSNKVGLVEANGTWRYHVVGPYEVRHIFNIFDGKLYWKKRDVSECESRKVCESINTSLYGERFRVGFDKTESDLLKLLYKDTL